MTRTTRGVCPAHCGQRSGLTIEEVEQVLHDPANWPIISRSTGRPAVFGTTATGKDILVVYEVLETEPVIVIRPITA
jgi:hypothetical protein